MTREEAKKMLTDIADALKLTKQEREQVYLAINTLSEPAKV